MRNQAKDIGAMLALAAFIIALAAGLFAGNAVGVTLTRALAAMILFQIVGWAAASLLSRLVRDHALEYAKRNPIPHVSLGASSVVEAGEEFVERKI